ncbi:hypothetical protein CcaverHIS002_0405360 [Cutaneotrichosporon cavernicola]|uniref:Major facilitator superfamily (MFS) profile domain-containing protein n=1 Tax=Cutaneotrichosporon cavernicola TaxID=279322 RepID=A0AA48QVU8_9TREE|nr:uncharacterized protein CcaverHIS019_0405330 [Cutaneotrichosporon cavernicola]BEI83932.1 hypothetical protein CcaverHIS002_0405360 [Cutaneotrichosporon cavernicola]BEI91713.1 hypothetical protein CcaverHIS019_0405330 [Cutaneotrichosporon cavernicola]BEJ07265.1 hypothetical protein CcaverHIS641_0405340 [Cutaneotrichosporon cavernicola]
MKKVGHAPDPDAIPTLAQLGVELHPDTLHFVEDPRALADALGGNSVINVFRNPIVFLAALCACVGGLMFGFDQGILSIVLTMKQFLGVFPETDINVTSKAGLNKGVMTALLELGAFLGAFMSSFVADRYSRKMSIVFGSVWFVIGSILQAASYSFAQLVVGRFIGGIGVGVLSSTAPMYISEIAPPNIRGAFLVLEAWSIVFGVVVMFYITYGTRNMNNDWSFRLPFTIQMAPIVILAGLLFFLPYSPRWLVQVGRDEEALQSLVRLRRLPATSPIVQAEWITIRAEAIRNRDVLVKGHPKLVGDDIKSVLKMEAASWVDMFRPGVIKRTMIGVALMVFQQFTGINALIYYSPTLFQQLGLDYEMQITMSGVLNCTQLAAVTVAFLFLDKVGRRPPLIHGAWMMAASHFIVAAMIGVYGKDWAAHGTQAWVGVAFILLFVFSYGMGWAPIPWTLPAEVHSSSRRAKGVAITTCTNWFCNFIIGLITPPMVQGTGFGTFIFFGLWAVGAFVWAILVPPETKGKTLEQIDAAFHSHDAADEVAAKRAILSSIVGTDYSRNNSKDDREWVESA